MTKLIAIHALHLASAVKGQIEVIEPGQAFDAREDEMYLTEDRVGAARKATSDDGAAKFIKRAGAAEAAAAAKAEDLSKLTKAELVALAAAEQISIDEKATNAVIVKAIEDARASKVDDAI
ncbi:hypothetical protein GOD54_23705 [Sinorhizobium medicae]|nr:hypothetical protein [Sinorhizobium medicae]